MRPQISLVSALVGLLVLPHSRVAGQAAECSKPRAIQGDPAQVESCRRLTAREPRNADAWETLGVALAKTGDYTGAIAAWREFVKLRPREYTGHYNLGLMYEMSRQPPAPVVHSGIRQRPR